MLLALIIAILFGAGLACLAGAVFAIVTRLHNAHCILLGMLAAVAIEIAIFGFGVRMPKFEPGAFAIALGLLVVAILASIFVGPLIMTRVIAHRETGV